VAEALSITIEVPDSRGRSLGRVKPKGLVSAQFGSSSERLNVPASVARALKKLQDNDELHPASMAALRSLVADVEEACAWKRLLGLINMRDYSAHDAAAKLGDDGFSRAVRASALERAERLRLIDDARFGEVFIRSKINAGWGRERIQRELERKGVPAASVPGWPDEFFSDELDYERAYAIASRKVLNGKNDFQKLMRLLASKGYASALAYRVAHDILEAAHASAISRSNCADYVE